MADRGSEDRRFNHQPNINRLLPSVRPEPWGPPFTTTGASHFDHSSADHSNDPFWIALQQQLRLDRQDKTVQAGLDRMGPPLHAPPRHPPAHAHTQLHTSLAPGTFRGLGLPELSPFGFSQGHLDGIDTLAEHLDPYGHAPLLFALGPAVGHQSSAGVDSGRSGPQTPYAPMSLAYTDSNGTISDTASQASLIQPQRVRPGRQPKAKPAADVPPKEAPKESKAPRKRKPKAQANEAPKEEELLKEEDLKQSPAAKETGRKRAKATSESDEQAAESPKAKKRRAKGGRGAGGFDSLRPMRKPRRSAREKRSVVGPVLGMKTPKKPLTAAMGAAAAAKAEQERHIRRNAWWCQSEIKANSSQAAGPDGSGQAKAPASFMRRPKLLGFHDPLLPPATDSENEDGDIDGKPRENDAEIKEKTLFNYTLCHFQMRQIMSRHLTDTEMEDVEKCLLPVLEHNMEIQLQLDYRDLWYLEETYVRQAAVHGKFLEGMLLPGLVLNRGGVVMYATESFCDMIQRPPQDVLMCSVLEFLTSDSIYNFVKISVGILHAPGVPYNVVFDCKFQRQDTREEIAGRVSMRVLHDIYGLVAVMSILIMPYTFQPDNNTSPDTIFQGIKFL